MVVQARADLIYAVNGYLRSFAEFTSMVGSNGGWKKPVARSGPRISSEVQGGDDGWKMPTRALVIRKAGGQPIGDDYALGLKTTRIDTFSYGATGAEADEVWALLDAILVPTDGRPAGFGDDAIRVSDIRPDIDAAAQTEPVTGYRRVFAPYIVTWISVPS